MKWNWVCAAVCLASVAAPAVADDEVARPVAAAEQLDVDVLVRKGESLIQVVLANHVDPPTRQEMWLAGTKAVFQNVPGRSPSGLSARISQITKPEEFRAFLRQAWFEELTPEQRRKALAPPLLTTAFLNRLLSHVRDAQLLTTSEGVAREQIAGNRYVGTGIQLGFDESGRVRSDSGSDPRRANGEGRRARRRPDYENRGS